MTDNPLVRKVLKREIDRARYTLKAQGERAAFHYARFHDGDPSLCEDGCSAGQPW